jgi:hypothetical protein
MTATLGTTPPSLGCHGELLPANRCVLTALDGQRLGIIALIVRIARATAARRIPATISAVFVIDAIAHVWRSPVNRLILAIPREGYRPVRVQIARHVPVTPIPLGCLSWPPGTLGRRQSPPSSQARRGSSCVSRAARRCLLPVIGNPRRGLLAAQAIDPLCRVSALTPTAGKTAPSVSPEPDIPLVTGPGDHDRSRPRFCEPPLTSSSTGRGAPTAHRTAAAAPCPCTCGTHRTPSPATAHASPCPGTTGTAPSG